MSKKIAIRIGISLTDYDYMTPSELKIYINIYKEKQIQEQDEKVTLAYLAAYLQRVDKMPRLSEVLHKEEMSPEEMLEKTKVLNAQMGGSVY